MNKAAIILSSTISLLALQACAAVDGPPEISAKGGTAASAEMLDAAGKPHGHVDLTSDGNNIIVKGAITGLAAGQYGMHLHAVGQCEVPDFKSAAGHWNPSARQHGSENPAGAHAGDLGNLQIGNDGRGIIDLRVEGQGLVGQQGLIDDDGAAIVVHAGPDDNMTDPSGNSGSRLLCGVFDITGR